MWGDKLTGVQIQYIQHRVDVLAKHFMGCVARGRRMAPGKVKEIADGRCFMGVEAQAVGLVDAISTWEDEVAAALERTLPALYGRLRGEAALQAWHNVVCYELGISDAKLATAEQLEGVADKFGTLCCAALQHEITINEARAQDAKIEAEFAEQQARRAEEYSRRRRRRN